jgi:hypothetical protein
MQGRVYDPGLGRFLSTDPIIQNPAQAQTLNPYSYIFNNPLAGIDPSGYQCKGGGICGPDDAPSGSDVDQHPELNNGKEGTALGTKPADGGTEGLQNRADVAGSQIDTAGQSTTGGLLPLKAWASWLNLGLSLSAERAADVARIRQEDLLFWLEKNPPPSPNGLPPARPVDPGEVPFSGPHAKAGKLEKFFDHPVTNAGGILLNGGLAALDAYVAYKDFKNGDYFGGAVSAVDSGVGVTAVVGGVIASPVLLKGAAAYGLFRAVTSVPATVMDSIDYRVDVEQKCASCSPGWSYGIRNTIP